MNESFEVVILDVAKNDLLQVVGSFEMRAKSLTDIESSGEFGGCNASGFSGALSCVMSKCEGDFCVTAKFHDLEVFKGVVLSVVLFRVIKYCDNFDVELFFYDSDVNDVGMAMRGMQAYIADLASKFQVGEFYGGMEPAVDIQTRYFTNESFGPLGIY
jgi:hypothetical protein